MGNTVPLFAHDVAISTVTKEIKSDDGKIKKEFHVELVFIDAVRQAAITRMILPMSVLEGMPKLIEDNLKKIKKDLNSKKKHKEEKSETKKNSYLG